MTVRTVAILGGGTGGLVAANRLRRMLDREHRIVLIDRSPVYSLALSFPWVMLGMRDGRRISRDLNQLKTKGIDVVTGEVQSIDAAAKTVRIDDREAAFDYLIVALGAQYSSDEIPGLGQAWTYYHLEGAEGLHERLQTFEAGRIAIVVSALPYKCPAAPFEGAFLLDHHFHRKNLRDKVEITVYTPEHPLPLKAAGPQVGERLVHLLSERGIGFVSGAQVAAVDNKALRIRFEDASEAPFDLLIATPVHKAPDVLVTAGFCPPDGWVQVDRETLATQFEDAYAIGDCNAIPLGDGITLPKAGVFAHGQAEVVARNIAAQISGGEPNWAFGGQGGCFLLTGGGRGAFVSGNFHADPAPAVELRGPSRRYHWQKIGFERLWLWRWF